MKVETKMENKILIIFVSGQVVGDASLKLRDDINHSIAQLPDQENVKLIIDLHGVSMIDCSGLGVIGNVDTTIKKMRGKIIFCGLTKGMNNLFKITKLSRILTVHNNVDEAIASFTKKGVIDEN